VNRSSINPSAADSPLSSVIVQFYDERSETSIVSVAVRLGRGNLPEQNVPQHPGPISRAPTRPLRRTVRSHDAG